jgi:hypothetical protein
LDYEPRRWHGLYFRAFDALRYDRFYGAFGSQMPITYLSISAYARDHGIAGAAYGQFLRLIHLLDGEFIRIENERMKAEKEQGATA